MSTEYRRGIPSVAHVEAATRLGLLWLGSDTWLHRFRNRNGQIEVWYFEDPNETPDWEAPDFAIEDLDFRPIHPNGTPVDWEVLDAEVARVGQQGQPQGFRADLWRRICRHFISADEDRVSSRHLSDVETIERRGCLFRDGDGWQWLEDEGPTRTDILARWTVYQELKPLYDIVDGAVGEVAMPRDVLNQWWLSAQRSDRARQPIEHCTLIRCNASPRYPQGRGPMCSWYADGTDALDIALRNFAAVLDAVAEHRVAERMRGQTRAPTVTSQPEPRRFADVRPDRHGWRWWLTFPANANDGLSGRADFNRRIEIEAGNYRWLDESARHRDFGNLRAWNDRTIIPTDEQGNPVSWESIGQAHLGQPITQPESAPAFGAIRSRYVVRLPTQAIVGESVRQVIESQGWQVSEFRGDSSGERVTVTVPLPTTGTYRAEVAAQIQPGQVIAGPASIEQVSPTPSRFALIELDDVDHSKTTKLDEVTLRRGKLPTVEQIAKYREVRARRTGGTVADALKESRIDCEVAQYVLERWAGGLGDANVLAVIEEVRFLDCAVDVDKRAAWFIGLTCGALDTSEKPNPTTRRERQEAEERRQRLAELRQRLATERAAHLQEMAKESDAASRFDLIEPDPQADPTVSIRAWEARQAAAKVRPTAVPARPAAVPRRLAIEVVDAEVDGLSRSEVFAALFGRALNGGC